MKKKYYKYVLIFLFCFIITFLYNFFFLNINCDEIWNYGFGYNISRGLIIYRDFNVLQTPLFFFIGSLFIKLFGSHIYSYDIYISVIISLFILICYKRMGKTAIILFFFIISNLSPSYNSLCVCLTAVIMFISDSHIKNRDFLIGFIIGIIFLTKQSIGIVLFFTMIIFNRGRIKGMIGFLIPNLIISIYLVYYNAFYDFINYCFLGMFDFGNSNLFVVFAYFVIFVVMFIIMLVQVIKSKFKDEGLLYVLAFQIMAYPIFDRNHVLLGLILYFVYIMLKYNKFFIKYYNSFLVIGICYFASICALPKNNFHLYLSDYSFLRGKGVYSDSVISYDNYINAIEKELLKIKKHYDNFHVYSIYFSELSYVFKLDLGYKIDKYDLILNGNMGYNGSSVYIRELDNKCKNESCLFLIVNDDSFAFSQTSRDIYYYVINTFEKKWNIKNDMVDFSVYSNVEDDVYE